MTKQILRALWPLALLIVIASVRLTACHDRGTATVGSRPTPTWKTPPTRTIVPGVTRGLP